MSLARILQKLAPSAVNPLALTGQALTQADTPTATNPPAFDSAQLAPLLQLQGARQLIEVIVESTENRASNVFQSMVLGVDTERGELILDELFPADNNLEPGQSARFHHSRDTLCLEFKMQLLERRLDPIDGHSCLVFSLPESIDYQSRRHFPRLYIDRSQPLTVQLRSPRMDNWFATAQNISAGGMRLAIGGNVTDQISRGSLLRQCDFKLSSDFKIRCQARVLGYKFQRTPYRHTQVSVSFCAIDQAQQQQLAQIIEGLTRTSNRAA